MIVGSGMILRDTKRRDRVHAAESGVKVVEQLRNDHSVLCASSVCLKRAREEEERRKEKWPTTGAQFPVPGFHLLGAAVELQCAESEKVTLCSPP